MYLPFIRLFKKGDPVRAVANAQDHNRVANVLNDIQGIGCRVVKPVNGDGRGWKIIVGDGSSDIDTTEIDPTFTPPKSSKSKITIAASDSSAGDIAAADYACDGTDDHEEINNAIASVSSNGTIYFYAGTYTIGDQIIVDKPISLYGAARATTIIQPKLSWTAASSAIRILGDSALSVGVKNLTVTANGSDKFYSAVLCLCGCACSIKNCALTYSSTANLYYASGGLSGMLTVVDSALDNSDGSGAWIRGEGPAFCHDSTFSNNGGDGVYLEFSFGFFNKCVASSNGANGFYRVSGGHGIASDCTASSNTLNDFSYFLSVVNCTALSNGSNDLGNCRYACNTNATNRVVTDDADAPVYSGSFSVVTSVNFGASTVTTKTITVAADGRITNVV